MILSQLEKMYDEAKVPKLVEMYRKSIALQKESDKLETEADSISENIVKTVKKRLTAVDGSHLELSKTLSTEQFKEMSKQWDILAASMVMVKRSIDLPGFHPEYKLMAHPRYGIKIHKRYSNYSPFDVTSVFHDLNNIVVPFSLKGDRLTIESSYEKGYLDFVVLQAIPQLNGDKIRLLLQLTEQIIAMMHSWKHFYDSRDKEMVKYLEDAERIGSRHSISQDSDYIGIIKNIDKLVAFKKQLYQDAGHQADKWMPVIAQWKEVNKNFMVLNELTKTELKV